VVCKTIVIRTTYGNECSQGVCICCCKPGRSFSARSSMAARVTPSYCLQVAAPSQRTKGAFSRQQPGILVTSKKAYAAWPDLMLRFLCAQHHVQ
jgi:hypothetical protein